MAEQSENTVTRTQKQEGADAIMDKGYVTERDIPEMMSKTWSEQLLDAVNDELRLRTGDQSYRVTAISLLHGATARSFMIRVS